MITNAKVSTPIGEGVCQGHFNPGNGDSSLAELRLLVRLPVNETTRTALHLANCLTPHAVKSGLWVFRASECGGGCLEFVFLAGVVALVLILLGICGWPW